MHNLTGWQCNKFQYKSYYAYSTSWITEAFYYENKQELYKLICIDILEYGVGILESFLIKDIENQSYNIIVKLDNFN